MNLASMRVTHVDNLWDNHQQVEESTADKQFPTRTVTRIVNKLTHSNWTLLYEGLVESFVDRSDRICFELLQDNWQRPVSKVCLLESPWLTSLMHELTILNCACTLLHSDSQRCMQVPNETQVFKASLVAVVPTTYQRLTCRFNRRRHAQEHELDRYRRYDPQESELE